MKKNKDMYIDYNRSYQRRNKKKGFRFLPFLLIVLGLMILSTGTYFAIEKAGKIWDDTKSQKKIGKQGEEEGGKEELKQQAVNDSSQNESKKEGQALESSDKNTADTLEEASQVFQNNAEHKKADIKVKGIYVSGPAAGSEQYMNDLIELVDTTELNAMVIDIKNDEGKITYKIDLDSAKEIGADTNYIKDISELIKKLKEKNIYLIARIVAFKDPVLAEERPELSLKKKNGQIFRDKDGLSWVNPYKKAVWDYLVSIGKEAAVLGFDEIQFDYIRFSTDSGMKEVNFGKKAKYKTKMEVISDFTRYACEALKPLGVAVSADVYGTIIDSKEDAKIVGQDYKKMAAYLDYISPMIYPSHYNDGAYGIKHPDMEPYQLILKALKKSKKALKGDTKGKMAAVRPWLQDFTATWLTHHKTYGKEEIRDQIKAVYDAGYEEWILWNGSNHYTKKGLLSE